MQAKNVTQLVLAVYQRNSKLTTVFSCVAADGDQKLFYNLDEIGTASTAYSTGTMDGYLDGDYKRVDPAYAAFIGKDLPRLAPWSISFGGSLDIPLDNMGYITVRGDWGFRDRNAYDDSNLNVFDQQRRYSGSVNWTSPEENWGVSLFGKNLSDEANYGNLTSIGGLYTAGPMQKGREYGLEVRYQL